LKTGYNGDETMKKVKLAVITSIAGLSMAMSANANAMDKQTENALVEVCKSAASDKSYKMHKTINEFNLSHKTVALKVMCNGQDIIAFAESRGAEKTAARLQRSIGDVDIIDVAALSKINVTFEE
tara:strand:- start:983 stop:1357 length:375 start_codon:yes stop_codon:yes gene_type:complete